MYPQPTTSVDTTVTVPLHANVPFPTGSQLLVSRYGSGNLTIAGESGVTLRAPNGARLANIYSVASLLKITQNLWYVMGDTKI